MKKEADDKEFKDLIRRIVTGHFKVSEIEFEELSQFLTPPFRALIKNFKDMDSLLTLPMQAAGELLKQEVYLTATFSAVLGDRVRRLLGKQKDADIDVSKEIQREVEDYLKKHQSDDLAEKIDNYYDQILKNQETERAVQVVVISLASMLWTAFECLTKDLWIASVNSFPKELGFHAIAGNKDTEGQTNSKHISVTVLAEHGFDLTKVLGDALQNRYDFTSTTGIKKAYKAVFGKKVDVDYIFKDENLGKLEIIRNLLVHRAGVVDFEFIKKYGTKLQAGEIYYPAPELISEFAFSVKSTSLEILKSIDQWAKNK